jgi:uncharacterized repeat protein (TIGR01451 family)
MKAIFCQKLKQFIKLLVNLELTSVYLRTFPGSRPNQLSGKSILNSGLQTKLLKSCKVMNVRILSLTASFLMFFLNMQAQKPDFQENALGVIRQFHHQWGLEEEDVKDIAIRDHYISRHNQVQHFYLQQRYRGIPIHNAITGIHLSPDGKVAHQTIGFQAKITQKVNADQPTLSAQAALKEALKTLPASPAKSGLFIQQSEPHAYLFGKGSISQLDIPVRLHYYPLNDQLRLAWEIQIYPVGQSDYWSIQIDAQSGALLEKNNWTLNCTFEHDPYEVHSTECFPDEENPKAGSFAASSPKNQNAAAYQVFPFPIESPIHGERRLIVDPADPLASPYGWHDTNAVVGPEFFTTKGNNVHAYFDTLANNMPDGDEATSEDLNFNFPYDPEKEPNFNKQAALTQLFYAGNFIHDFAYYYGFDEQAGNFQNNNYRRGGLDGDEIIAEAMDGSGKNNANFLPLPDGNKGRMQMYLWDLKAGHFLNIESPVAISGTYRAGTASFGPSIDTLDIRGRVVQVMDNSESPATACETIINKEEIKGNIALVYRGKCRFWEKIINAQKAGAQAVIIANDRNSIFNISGSPAEPINIPSILVSNATAERIKNTKGPNIIATFQQPEASPKNLDASFDNGVIAHEYAHGISSRLTGGPSTTGCLRNDEQMGEGWSDFFGLVVTTSHPDNRTKGVGNYPNGSQTFGAGIRRRPYSPLDQFNEFTYYDIINTSGPHPLGEVWASMLWDLYWAFSDQYGWDPDLFNGQGGNNMAIQLVMDGLKLQACEPGFIDGRDAILKADSINYKGANQCLIWSVFAKRGLGWSAEQGSSDDRKDGREAFDLMPGCIQKLKIRKEAINTSIEAGEPIRYKIEIRNDKATPVSELIIHDQLPEEATFIPFTVNGAEFVSQNGRQVVFRVNRIEAGKSTQIQYLVQTSSGLGSKRIYFDDFQASDQNWNIRARSGGRTWRLITDTLNDFKNSWFVPNSQRTNAHFLELQKDIPVSGRLPVLRFHHDFVTEPVSDAGLLEISTDEGQNWTPLSSDQFLRNGYSGEIDFSTFLLHDQGGFWGDQPDIQESIIDLSKYIGQKVRIRFQFQSDSEPSNSPYDKGIGWTIHDIEFMDLQYYNTEVCVSSDQGDFACAVARELGTTVGSIQELTSAKELSFQEKIKLDLYPNPLRDFLNIQIEAVTVLNELNLQILSADGRILQSRQETILPGQQLIGMDVNTLPAGIYFLKVQHEGGVISKKIIKR